MRAFIFALRNITYIRLLLDSRSVQHGSMGDRITALTASIGIGIFTALFTRYHNKYTKARRHR
jgi:hypothetical protein